MFVSVVSICIVVCVVVEVGRKCDSCSMFINVTLVCLAVCVVVAVCS